jgi:L-fuculose-phosphate aldolase
MGYTSSVSGNQSIRIPGKKSMWITPSGVPRYNLKKKDLVKVGLENGTILGGGGGGGSKISDKNSSNRLKPSIEWRMHASIYNKLLKVNAIVHTHSPYTIAIAISVNEFQHIIEEAKIIVGNPILLSNSPSGSIDLADAVSKAFEEQKEARAVIIRNHEVVSIGNGVYQARAVIESLEEWAKILTISKIFDGPKNLL